MYCKNCGWKLKDTHEYCVECGKLNEEYNPNGSLTSTKPLNKSNRFFIDMKTLFKKKSTIK